MLSVALLIFAFLSDMMSVVLLSVAFFYCYAECRHALIIMLNVVAQAG
jgi:hypothetical protein